MAAMSPARRQLQVFIFIGYKPGSKQRYESWL
jgi:hypothetical protein